MNTLQFLFDLPTYQRQKYPKLVAGGHWRQGQITNCSIDELDALVNSIAIWFLKNGIQKNDRVILLTQHFSIEWLAVDMAIMAVGAISVPVHFPQREEDIKLIFDRMEPVLVIHSSSISIQTISFSKKSISFENLLQNKRAVHESEIQQLTNIRDSLSISDIATIVHTSGSSGEPRA